MKLIRLEDGDETFNVSVYETGKNSSTVLFAVGSGGLPDRYDTLIKELMNSGCTVIAPHFERLASPFPTEQELLLRGRRLSLTLNAFSQTDVNVTAVGHSIGATILLALAGAQMWLGPELKIHIPPESRLSRLALLAPPTGFFQAPGALDGVNVPTLVWVGSEDKITPPEQSRWLVQTLSDPQLIDFRLTEGAGHFSFMDQAPPNTLEPLTDKNEFIVEYAREVSKFIIG